MSRLTGKGYFTLLGDIEGIVAKRKSDPYLPEHATWLKIRNPNYSQWGGREELLSVNAAVMQISSKSLGSIPRLRPPFVNATFNR